MIRVALLACLVVTLAWATETAAQDMPVPSEVEQYVTSSNFVAALSTPQERLALARYDAREDVKQDTGSERLAAVFVHAQQLEALEIEVDPGMNVSMQREQELRSPPGLLQVENVRSPDDLRMFVEFLVYRPDQESVAAFIAAYEENDAPPEIETAFRTAPRRMVQEWIRIDGSWRKKEAYLFYLDR